MALSELETRVGVCQGFFSGLLEEDDWSFVIKLHALFEAACTHLLLFHFKEPELSTVLCRLELSNKTTGKVAFLAALGLLGTDGRRFIAALSELRNNLVHDVRNCEFVLAEWVTTLDSAQLKRFAVCFSPSETLARESAQLFQRLKKAGLELSPQATVEAVVARAREKPKLHMWLGAYGVLSGMLDMYGYSEYRQWTRGEEVLRDEE